MESHRRNLNEDKHEIATRTTEILNGEIIIPQLNDSKDTIGEMKHECHYCGALKFKSETSSLCCLDGKIALPHFPQPPEEMKKLWLQQVPEAKVFLQHTRVINNAICLSSVVVTEKVMPNFNPSVIFQGRVNQLMGPLQAQDGVRARFAQLYVLDSSMETTIRIANMNMPSNISVADQNTLKKLLETVQQVMHQRNPYIQDFKQILETPDEDLYGGKVVISAAAKPTEGHSRVYNVQQNLQELSIVTNEKPHDLVIQKRGGGLFKISDLNAKAMPLHFTLLFPEGTYGYDQDLRHISGIKRVSPREFFAYHLNIRHQVSDHLFRARRLFQEWILHAWITCEHQRLNYQRQHQKDLRADTYKNVQEAVAGRLQERQQPEDSLYQENEVAVGRKILTSSFQCSPRWYNQKFQDAMAIVR